MLIMHTHKLYSDICANNNQAWLFASEDITNDITTPSFRTLPAGQVGLYSHNRTAHPLGNLTTTQWIAEEGDVVEMGQVPRA